MGPGDKRIVERQELDLDQEQQEDRPDDQCCPADRPEDPAERPFACLRRAGEKLDEDVARQLPPEPIADRVVLDLPVKRLMIALRLVGQHHEMHEDVSMDDDEQDRRQKEEGEQRQIDTEDRQLDRIFEKEIGVRDRSRRDCEIKQHEQIGEPQRPADRGGVLDRLLDFLEVTGLFGEVAAGRASWRGARALETGRGFRLARPRRRRSWDAPQAAAAFPIPWALCPKTAAPGGRRDIVSTSIPRGIKRTAAAPKIFRQFLAESQKRSYNGCRRNEASDDDRITTPWRRTEPYR